ncbi:PHP domain-containing protein [bacterium]|nr:PHP domain-containing protein [bacterium]
MLKVDFHTHTMASGHALNSLEEMLLQADRIGLEGIAITDHSPGIDNTIWLLKNQPETADWQSHIKGPDLPYFMTFVSRFIKPAYIKVAMFKGIECNILGCGNRSTDVPLFIAGLFDIVIASIHPIPSLFVIENGDQVTERVVLAMEDPIDIIGHPYHGNYCPYIEPVVKAASEKGIALEMNNSSLKLGKADVEQAVLMLKLSIENDCSISLASDAHMSGELGQNSEILKLLKEVEFPEELIVNRSLQTAREFVKSRKEIRKTIVESRK